MWNLVSACSVCQGQPPSSWSQWISSCSESHINVGKYPLPIPSGVLVPRWAYRDFTAAGMLNTALDPEPPAGSSTLANLVGAPTRVVAVEIDHPPPQTKSNTDVIAGAVIGGIAVLALSSLILYLIVTKLKQKKSARNADDLIPTSEIA
ncbi:Glycophorin A domain-containing protein [Ceratobasidium theobromae]|uniref:Glycophorin A domain-containing protein n=1 Tax=Ceratobasidium theobromae TaxID=1582974 RepID=A0A5N5QME7_9AGAM|nr:Glycophorin A domain-containing protein [Ceratobasidium theobromae]